LPPARLRRCPIKRTSTPTIPRLSGHVSSHSVGDCLDISLLLTSSCRLRQRSAEHHHLFKTNGCT
jgi:hypothetical protein